MSKLHSTDCCKDANSCGKKEIIIKQVKIGVPVLLAPEQILKSHEIYARRV